MRTSKPQRRRPIFFNLPITYGLSSVLKGAPLTYLFSISFSISFTELTCIKRVRLWTEYIIVLYNHPPSSHTPRLRISHQGVRNDMIERDSEEWLKAVKGPWVKRKHKLCCSRKHWILLQRNLRLSLRFAAGENGFGSFHSSLPPRFQVLFKFFTL